MSKFTLTRLTFNIHKRFFTAKPLDKSTPTTNTTTSQNAAASSSSFTIDYLTNSCGLSLKSAISASKRVNLVEYNKQHYDSVVNFLKSNEFSDTQVVKLVQKHPAVLSSRISTNLQPKFQFFTQNGVSSSVLPKIFVLLPNIIFRSVDAQLRPVMQFLRKYITSDDKVEVAILRGSWIFNCDVKNKLMPNVEFLIQQGVPKNRIGYMLVAYPRCLFYYSLEKFASAIDRTRVMGVKPSDNIFIDALCAVLQLSELSWKKKVEVFESMGWSYDEVVSMFVRRPGHQNELSKFRSALEEWGFFQVINHGMTSVYLDELVNISKQFFALPLEEKLKCSMADDFFNGYGNAAAIAGDTKSLNWNDKLFLTVHPKDQRKLQLRPEKPDSFSEVLHDYSLRFNDDAGSFPESHGRVSKLEGRQFLRPTW